MEKITRITPKNKLFSWDDIIELWNYRELLYFFSWRDLKVRYKQTAIGVLWAVIQPFTTMIVFSVFFGGFAKIPSEGIPYPIFVYTGLLLWNFFSNTLTDVSNSMITNQSVITKVYFPRLIAPLSVTATHLVDFIIGFGLLIVIMIYYRFVPNFAGFIIMPVLLLISAITAIGSGLILASVNIRYRDVRYALPFFIQLLLFVTPVIYPASILKNYAWILGFNPMSGVISTARVALFGLSPISYLSLIAASGIACVAFVFGVIAFRKMEIFYADYV